MTALLTIPEVAEALGMSTAQVYTLARSGILPTVRLGRSVRIAEDQLDRWIRDGGQSWPGGWRRELQ
ncbi:MAG: helix-turn-helix domain-containing protein [Clostridia bacterium]